MDMPLTPVSAAVRKSVASLSRAKSRRESGLFVAEGTKCVLDTSAGFECVRILATPTWYENHHTEAAAIAAEKFIATKADLERMSALTTAADVMAVFRMPRYQPDFEIMRNKLVVALDHVQDPGNLGTIVRVCDWMGVTDILASEQTVDVFNPKVVQATMGSIARVRVHYVNLPAVLGDFVVRGVAVYGTFLDGKNIYDTELGQTGVIVMGNEGNGITAEVASKVTHRLFLPSFPPESPTAESLNVAIATSLTLAEFRRRQFC